MHGRPATTAFVAFMLAGVQVTQAQSEYQSLSWSKLGAAVANQEVTLVLSSGVRVKGTVESVLEDALAVNIHKTSNTRLYAAGQASIARKDISEVRIKRVKGPGRVIGAAGIGAAGAFASLPWALSENRVNVSDSSRMASWAVISAGCVVGGYLIGRAIDTKETVITIGP